MTSTHPTPHHRLGAHLGGPPLALLAFFLYNIHDGLNKSLVANLGTGFAAGSVMLVATLGYFILLLARKQLHHLWAPGILTTLLISAGVAAANIGFFMALPHIPLAELFVFVLTIPAFATIIATLWLGERLSSRQLMGFLLAIAACMVSMRVWEMNDLTHFLAYEPLAVLGIAIHVVIYSLRPSVVRKYAADANPIILSTYSTGFTAVALWLLFNPIWPEMMATGDAFRIGVSALLAFIAQMVLFQAFQRGPAGLTASTQYTQMLWSALMGWIFFAEQPATTTMMAAMMIIFSGVLLFWPQRHHHKNAS